MNSLPAELASRQGVASLVLLVPSVLLSSVSCTTPIGCDADNGAIELANGFCARVVADDLGPARHMTVSPSGDLFVAIRPSADGATPGRIVALRDEDGDGTADIQRTFNDKGGNDLVWRDGYLYFAENDRILRYVLPDGTLEPASAPEVIVTGLPVSGDHKSKSIAFDNEGRLLVDIGSASNACQLDNRVVGSPGVDPCPELETRAGIWRFSADETDQTLASAERFATGLRNIVALAVQPKSGHVYGVQNGRDQLHELWPDSFSEADDASLPSEELLRIEAGKDYGWPYCYHDPARGKVLAPEYGGDGVSVGRCESAEEPEFAFPAHWAPLDMLFYTGKQFPGRYRAGVFVASHGSRFAPNASGDLPGYNVVFLPISKGEPGPEYEDFAKGFAGDARPLPDSAAYRPVGLAQAKDGSVYVSDDQKGRVWRIRYAK